LLGAELLEIERPFGVDIHEVLLVAIGGTFERR